MYARRSFPLAILAALLVTAAARESAACYDSDLTIVGPVRIEITQEEGSNLSCATDKVPCATWALRLARILPEGARLEIRSGFPITKGNDTEIQLCLAGRPCTVRPTKREDVARIFDELAARFRIPAAQRARMLRLRPSYY